MAADGPNADSEDLEFDPRSGDLECTEEHIESELKAPDEELWYHGRLDRQSAEECLRNSGKVGSYLIRESYSKPGSFVLSYLGPSGPPTHFRILAMCGDYYIGGRQFESLSDLIGYYTACSCLFKNEQLKYPVPPAEPVDDRRRVLAMFSYRKMPETDELNFDKGDTFIVHNELENEWLWVSAERTKESGLVPAQFVEDLKCDGDPVEALSYFHGNITKEEAVEKLMKAGEGSYLIRPSENSPGDYSLFFLCGKEVRRFRIEKKGRYLHLGGRYFDSLDDIIKRYTSEEIVDGSKLVSAVYRTNRYLNDIDNRFEAVDGMEEIYSSIHQSSGPSLLTRSNDRIDMTGFLNKRSDRKKLWKPFYFVLNGTEKYLYYFENEKKSKPKGIIDLGYSALYPVHSSLFGRPNCFQIVSNYDNNNEQICYVCADSSDLAQKWIQFLKPYCENSRAPKPQFKHALLKEFHKLVVSVLDAHRLPPKQLNHPYCVLALNNVRVGRTDVGEGANPFWSAEFFLDDIPPTVESFTVSLFNKIKRLKDTEIASVTVPLSDLAGRGFVDNAYQLQPVAGMKGEMGSLRLKSRYQHEVIMPEDEYTSLKELLFDDEFDHILTLAQVSEESERSTLAHALLQIFRHERKEASLLCALNDKEIEKEDEVSTLFRAGSLATTLMVQYMKMTSTIFVHKAVRESVQKIVELKQSCELDPKFLENTTDQQSNSEFFLRLLTEVVESIFTSTEACPPTLRYVCNCLQKRAKTKWPADDTVKTRVVSGFIFLRLLCPAILNPKSFNLVQENPSETAARTLKLVAKVLQNLANLVDVGPKEAYMEVVQPFVKKYRDKMILYLDELSNVPKEPLSHEVLPGDPARELATIHQLCATHLESLKSHMLTQVSTKKIVVVTEMLTNHKKRYMGDT
ncbi:ras GTPase-activating protein 1 [Aplysia californica]|uniref:Ras GTPase-activating protein 1 n=1 Tax=Aplysia californica TaxID=6500 RepID=A0ABM0JWI1_APLCA|nr:ras GTPase-activating protein 1 [Aplysia californica]